MIITYRDNIFIATSSYAEKEPLKTNRWWWHGGAGTPGGCRPKCQACAAGIGRVWWTPDPAKALPLFEVCDAAAQQVLNKTKEVVQKSRATSADIVLPVPQGLDYLPFQKAGIRFACDVVKDTRKGILIGDEMGLGKTIQALGFINANPEISAALVICPATLRLNWLREAKKWLTRKFEYWVSEKTEGIPDDATFAIVNYDKARTPKVWESLMARNWDVMICDEAHQLKSLESQRTVRVLGAFKTKKTEGTDGLIHRSRSFLALSGTPMVNRPAELFPLLHAIDPDSFKSKWTFYKNYCGLGWDGYSWNYKGASNLGELNTKLRGEGYMIRRLKNEVLTELPPKRRQVVVLPANGSAKVVEEERRQLDAFQDELEKLRAEADLALAAGDTGAYEESVEKLTYKTKTAFAEIARIRHDVAVAKAPAVIDHVNGMLEEGVGKVVVFLHHHDVCRLFEEAWGSQAVTLTGETPMDQRQEVVDQFQNNPEVKIFLASIVAAGVGITLTASSNVVFAELDWVPGNISQAEDRCHRIGQQNSVFVQHLVYDKSLDAKMAKILVAKQEVADRALDQVVNMQMPIVISAPKEEAPAKYPKTTDEEKVAAKAAMQLLDAMCDGARVEDFAGFNKIDTLTGKSLARVVNPYTDGQVWLARRLATKYRRQLPDEIIAALGIVRG